MSLLFAYGKNRFSHDVAHIMPVVAISGIQRLLPAVVTENAGLSLTCLKTPKTGFLVMWLI